MAEALSPLAVLATLADRLGDCARAPHPCDCLICAADHGIERGFRSLFSAIPGAGSDD